MNILKKVKDKIKEIEVKRSNTAELLKLKIQKQIIQMKINKLSK